MLLIKMRAEIRFIQQILQSKRQASKKSTGSNDDFIDSYS